MCYFLISCQFGLHFSSWAVSKTVDSLFHILISLYTCTSLCRSLNRFFKPRFVKPSLYCTEVVLETLIILMYNSEHFLGYVIFFHLPSVNLQVFGSQNCTLTLGEISTSWIPPETDRPRRKKFWRFEDLVTSNCKQYYNRCFIQKCPENFLCLFFFGCCWQQNFSWSLSAKPEAPPLFLLFCFELNFMFRNKVNKSDKGTQGN